MTQQFTRSRRLLNSKDFSWVFDRAQKSADAYFTVLARCRHEHNGASRLGLAIAKKQLRRAVDRNRIKRLAREVFRQLPASDLGLDFVVMARTKAIQQTNPVLRESLQKHFHSLEMKTRTPRT